MSAGFVGFFKHLLGRIWQKTSTVDRVWGGFFLVWLLLLSGAFNRWTGGPGLLQWYRIHGLVLKKQARLAEVEAVVMRLSTEQVRLEKSPVAQRREVRRVLGYLAPDEILFDFSSDPVQPRLARR